MARFLLFLGFMTLASCGFKSQTALDVNNNAGIMGGTLVSQKDPVASIIVGIYDSKDHAICTGSIISENFVLTAAHCVYGVKASKLKLIFGLELDSIISTREQDVLQDLTRSVLDYKVYKTYNPDEQETKDMDWGDIAIIKFSGGLPEGYKPVSIFADDSALKTGAWVTVAGYGVSQVDTETIDPKKFYNIEEAMAYGEVFCDEEMKNCLKVDMSGDGVLRQTKTVISSFQESEFRLDESKGHGTCSGDSGGPAYIEKDGEYYLYGVTSRGSPLCDEVGIYTNVTYYKGWIEEMMQKMQKVQK